MHLFRVHFCFFELMSRVVKTKKSEKIKKIFLGEKEKKEQKPSKKGEQFLEKAGKSTLKAPFLHCLNIKKRKIHRFEKKFKKLKKIFKKALTNEKVCDILSERC